MLTKIIPAEGSTPPKLVESIPTVTAPIDIPAARPVMSHGRFLAGVITGGAALVLASALLVVGLVVSA